jgi:hypothetical protein
MIRYTTIPSPVLPGDPWAPEPERRYVFPQPATPGFPQEPWPQGPSPVPIWR